MQRAAVHLLMSGGEGRFVVGTVQIQVLLPQTSGPTTPASQNGSLASSLQSLVEFRSSTPEHLFPSCVTGLIFAI